MLRETLAAATLLTTLLAAGCAPAQSARPAPPARQGQLDLRADCGAVGDNKSDDSQALKTCLARMQSEMDAGHPTVLRIPAGIYRITGANGAMPTLRRHGGTIQGDGPHASYIVLDKSYAGDLSPGPKRGRPIPTVQLPMTRPATDAGRRSRACRSPARPTRRRSRTRSSSTTATTA